jgi:hypothetical protein
LIQANVKQVAPKLHIAVVPNFKHTLRVATFPDFFPDREKYAAKASEAMR